MLGTKRYEQTVPLLAQTGCPFSMSIAGRKQTSIGFRVVLVRR